MKNVFPLIFLLGILQFQAQDPDQKVLDFTPPSPTASELTKFEAQQPNLYTGTASTSIPLYTIDFDGWSLPLSLSYHASGIRANQEATEVGLGWALNSTAVITRRIKKNNDLQGRLTPSIKGYVYDTRDPIAFAEDLRNYRNLSGTEQNNIDLQLQSNEFDTEPDIFDYSFFGFSGSFVLSKRNSITGEINVIQLQNNDVQVSFNEGLDETGDSFTIQTPTGFEGLFSIKERSTNMGSSGSITAGTDGNYGGLIDILTIQNRGNHRVITAWYLERITSPKGKVIEFNYNINPDQYSTYISMSSTSYGEKINESAGPITESFSRQVVEHVYQQTISIANELSIQFTMEDREDIALNNLRTDQFTANAQKPRRYTGIQITGLDPASTFTKNIVFGQSYFNGDFMFNMSPSPYSAEPMKYAMLRGRLDDVTIDDQNYHFTYNKGMGLPDKSTKVLDYFGFYNGINLYNWLTRIKSGTYLRDGLDPLVVPCNELHTQIGYKYYYQEDHRRFNLDYAIGGSLKKVVYPTGGYTTFDYEPHAYFAEGAPTPSPGSLPMDTPEAIDRNGTAGTALGGGLRIKEINTYAKIGATPLRKSYSYTEQNGTQSSGRLLNPMAFFYFRDDLVNDCTDMNPYGNYPSYFFMDASGILGQNMAEGKEVGYNRVVETVHGPGLENYTAEHTFVNLKTEYTNAFNTIESRSYKNGKPITKLSKREGNQTLQDEVYTLTENPQGYVYGLSYNNKVGGGVYSQFLYKMPIGSAEIGHHATTKFFYPGSVQTDMHYEYNNLTQLKAEESTNSKGEVLRTEYKRLEEFSGSACVYASDGVTCLGNALFDENIVSPVLEKLTYVGDSVIAATGYRYDLEEGNVVLREVLEYDGSKANFTSSANGFEFPAYRSVVVYEDYDSEGNVLQYTVADGPTTSLIWGYNEEYPIVKGENIGHTDLAQAHTTALSNPTTYEDNIRSNSLTQKALITTYTFDPMVGMVEMHDPSARKTAYSYDAFRRLETIKDLNNDLLQDYEYHYATPAKAGGLSVVSGINFGVVGPDSVRTINTGIKNEGNYDITISGLSLPTNFSSPFASQSFLVKAGDTFNLPVTYTSPNPGAGIETGTMVLQSTDNLDGNVILSLSANSAFETRILSLPQSNYQVSTGFDTVEIELRNDGNSPITVTSVDIDSSSEFELLTPNLVIPPNYSRTVDVRLQHPVCPLGIWDGSTTITIYTDADPPVFVVQAQITSSANCNP